MTPTDSGEYLRLTQRERHLLLGLFGVPSDSDEIEMVVVDGLLRCRSGRPALDAPLWPPAAAYYLKDKVANGILTWGERSILLGQLRGLPSTLQDRENHLALQQALLGLPRIGPLLQRCLKETPTFTAPAALGDEYAELFRPLLSLQYIDDFNLHAQVIRRTTPYTWNLWGESGGKRIPLQENPLREMFYDNNIAVGTLQNPFTNRRIREFPDLITPEGNAVMMHFLLSTPVLAPLGMHLAQRVSLKLFPQPAYLIVRVREPS